MISVLQSRDNGIPMLLTVILELGFSEKYIRDLIDTLELKTQSKESKKIDVVTKQQLQQLRNYIAENYETLFQQIATSMDPIVLRLKHWLVLTPGNIDSINHKVC